MKLWQLIKVLLKFLPGSDVKVTWEGQEIDIQPKNVYKSKDGKVIIDADKNYYKQDFTKKGRK